MKFIIKQEILLESLYHVSRAISPRNLIPILNGIKFDLIFVDPPYDYDVYEKILRKVDELNLLNDKGLIVLEHHNLKFDNEYGNLVKYKERNYGNKDITIYKNNVKSD